MRVFRVFCCSPSFVVDRCKSLSESAPDDLTPVEAIAHRLETLKGRKLYDQRKHIPEPVFGIINSVFGFRQFLLSGLDKVQGEWNPVTMARNLKHFDQPLLGHDPEVCKEATQPDIPKR